MKEALTFASLLVAVIAVILSALSDFKPCEKCGSRITLRHDSESPDASYGPKVMHQNIHRKCLRCGHNF
jgi:hypothetical protein